MKYYPKYPYKIIANGYQVPPIYLKAYYDHFIYPQYLSPYPHWYLSNYRLIIR